MRPSQDNEARSTPTIPSSPRHEMLCGWHKKFPAPASTSGGERNGGALPLVAALPVRLPRGVLLAPVIAGTQVLWDAGAPLQVEAWWTLTSAHTFIPAVPLFLSSAHSCTASRAGGHTV